MRNGGTGRRRVLRFDLSAPHLTQRTFCLSSSTSLQDGTLVRFRVNCTPKAKKEAAVRDRGVGVGNGLAVQESYTHLSRRVEILEVCLPLLFLICSN